MLLPAIVWALAVLLHVSAAWLQRPWSFATKPQLTLGNRKRYDGQVVVRLQTNTPGDSVDIYSATEKLDLDIWSRTDEHTDVRLARDTLARFFDLIPDHLRNATTEMIPDLQHAIDHTTIPKNTFSNERIPSIDDTFFSDFQNVGAIDTWLNLVVQLHPSKASLINLGKTYEGRDVKGLSISKPRSAAERIKSTKRKVILIHGAQHAREWISVSTVCYLAYSLIAGSDTDPSLKRLVRDYDWIFIPTLNIDGYAHSFEDRLWRKNRQSTSAPYCMGIDLDRNWDFGWDKPDTSAKMISSPCSENYQGSEAFEALETRMLSDYIQTIHDNPNYKLVGYLDLHSYAQTILYPYALSCNIDVRDEESLIELGVGASKAMRQVSGEHYDTASACNQDGHVFSMAEANSGAALDWVYHSGVPWSYVVKLRDTGSYGFLVPKEEIVPTGDEMLAFLKYFGTFITEHSH